MTKLLQEFEKIVESGDLKELVAFFKDMPETERKQYAAAAVRQFKKNQDYDLSKPNVYLQARMTATLAVIVTGSIDHWKKLNWVFSSFSNNLMDALQELKCKPDSELADVMLSCSWLLYDVREMVRRDILEKPDSDNYIIAVMASAREYSYNYQRTRPNEKVKSFYEWLGDNSDLLEDDIWRFFEVEGNQEHSLSALDKYCKGNSWEDILKRLSKEDKLSRSRLLKSSLEALDRGFIQFRSAWYSNFHESMEPTIEERNELIDHYLQLVGSPIPPTVSFAVNALKVLDKAGLVPPEKLFSWISPCFTAKQKSVVMSGLSLIEKAIKKDKTLTESACVLAADGLLHESPEVQEKVVAFLEKYANASTQNLNQKISDYAEAVSPSVRAKLQPLLGDRAGPKGAVPLKISQKYEFDKNVLDGWPLAHSEAVVPIKNKEELLKRAAFCLENPQAAMELEVVMDAVSRINVKNDETFSKASQPLVKRSEKLIENLGLPSNSSQFISAIFFYSWLGKPEEIYSHTRRSRVSILKVQLLRMNAILQRVEKNQFLPLLALPTHQGGWVEQIEFEKRKSIWKDEGVTFDKFDEEVGKARFPILDDCESRETALEDVLEIKHLVSDIMFSEVAPMLAVAIPSLRDSVLHAAINESALFINFNLAESRELRHYYELLTQRGSLLDKRAIELMNIGLIMPDPQCAGFARDAMIIAIDEHRLSPEALGARVGVFLHSDKSKPKRLTQSLQEVARISPSHMDAVRQVIERALQGSSENIHREIPALLEFYREVLVSCGKSIENPETIKYLRSIKTGGKTAKLVKELIG